MLILTLWLITMLTDFAPIMYGITTWYKAEVLVTGAILATGKRTVSAELQVMGLSQEGHYAHITCSVARCGVRWRPAPSCCGACWRRLTGVERWCLVWM